MKDFSSPICSQILQPNSDPKECPLTCSGLNGYQCKGVVFGETGVFVKKNLTLVFHLGSNFTSPAQLVV